MDYLKELIPFLKSEGVFSFKYEGLELSFYVEPHKTSHDSKQQDSVVSVDESQLPVDLRTDNITGFDSILNWSASPAQNEIELPLTGDIPLDPISSGDLSQ